MSTTQTPLPDNFSFPGGKGIFVDVIKSLEIEVVLEFRGVQPLARTAKIRAPSPDAPGQEGSTQGTQEHCRTLAGSLANTSLMQ